MLADADAATPSRTSSIIEKARRATASIRQVRHQSFSSSSVATTSRVADPFRGSTLIYPMASSEPKTQPAVPPLPTNRIQRSDGEVAPGYTVMPLTSDHSRSASPSKPVTGRGKDRAERVPDKRFFEAEKGSPRERQTMVQPRPVTLIMSAKPAVPPAPPRQGATASAPPIDVDSSSGVRKRPREEVDASSVASDSPAPPRRPTVPLNTLFMPKKKRR